MIQLGKWLVGLFFFLMLIIPTVLQTERGVFLAFLCVGTIMINPINTWKLSKVLFYWLIACVMNSVLSIIWGILNDAPGALRVSTVYVVWPILYVYFIGFAKTIENYVFLVKVLLIGGFFAVMSAVLLLASSFYPVLRVLDPYFELMRGNVGLYSGTVEITLDNMASYIYCLPFLMTLLLIVNIRKSFFLSHKWIIFCAFSMLILFFSMLISGRRGFVAVTLLSMPLSLTFLHITKIINFRLNSIIKIFGGFSLVIMTATLISIMALDIDFSVVQEDFLAGFDFGDKSNISASRRAEQFYALIDEWQTSPITGLGHGNYPHSLPGEYEGQPWGYELQYVALLFQTGIIGMLVYGSSVIWLMRKMIILSRKYDDLAELLLPSLVALICFLVANSTNPYLSKFDYLWTLFLPVGLVNIGLLREKSLRTTYN